jgi:hypothetical protein
MAVLGSTNVTNEVIAIDDHEALPHAKVNSAQVTTSPQEDLKSFGVSAPNSVSIDSLSKMQGVPNKRRKQDIVAVLPPVCASAEKQDEEPKDLTN